MSMSFAVVAYLQAAQRQADVPNPGEVDVAVGLASGAGGSFLLTFLVGAVLIALAPEYLISKMDTVREDPLDSFLYGIFVLLAIGIMSVALAITGIGLLVVIPLLLLATVVWAVGSAIAFLAIAERLVGREDGWLKPLVVAAAIDGGLTLTGIGALIAVAVAATGFGAIVRDRL